MGLMNGLSMGCCQPLSWMSTRFAASLNCSPLTDTVNFIPSPQWR